MNIKLRPLEASDRTSITQLINNKKIWDNLKDYIPHPYHIEDADNFINFKKEEDPIANFGIVNDSNDFLGIIGLERKDDIYRLNAEIGYWIGEPYWGKGIATKAIGMITKYGFEQLKLERIYAGVFDFNTASMKVLKNNGYTLESISRNALIKNEKILNEHVYVKLRSEHYNNSEN